MVNQRGEKRVARIIYSDRRTRIQLKAELNGYESQAIFYRTKNRLCKCCALTAGYYQQYQKQSHENI